MCRSGVVSGSRVVCGSGVGGFCISHYSTICANTMYV